MDREIRQLLYSALGFCENTVLHVSWTLVHEHSNLPLTEKSILW